MAMKDQMDLQLCKEYKKNMGKKFIISLLGNVVIINTIFKGQILQKHPF